MAKHSQNASNRFWFKIEKQRLVLRHIHGELIGAIRRERFDYMVGFAARRQGDLLLLKCSTYMPYYKGAWTDLSLHEDAPRRRPLRPSDTVSHPYSGRIISSTQADLIAYRGDAGCGEASTRPHSWLGVLMVVMRLAKIELPLEPTARLILQLAAAIKDIYFLPLGVDQQKINLFAKLGKFSVAFIAVAPAFDVFYPVSAMDADRLSDIV